MHAFRKDVRLWYDETIRMADEENYACREQESGFSPGWRYAQRQGMSHRNYAVHVQTGRSIR